MLFLVLCLSLLVRCQHTLYAKQLLLHRICVIIRTSSKVPVSSNPYLIYGQFIISLQIRVNTGYGSSSLHTTAELLLGVD